jgi:hypothetical protein
MMKFFDDSRDERKESVYSTCLSLVYLFPDAVHGEVALHSFLDCAINLYPLTVDKDFVGWTENCLDRQFWIGRQRKKNFNAVSPNPAYAIPSATVLYSRTSKQSRNPA